MTILEMLSQSGVLALLGMGVVFGFLVIMIIAVTVMGKLLHVQTEAAPPAPAATAGDNPEVIAAITASVNEYRKENH
jgi:oxaloacetate decarboxylase gamma subunit